VEARYFKKMIDKTSMMTASVEDKRPHVLGVCLETIQKEDENWIRIISTDGNRLAKVDYPCVNEYALTLDRKVLVQKKGINELSKIIIPHGTLFLGILENKLFIKQQQETVSIQLINGTFPDVSDILFIKDARQVILNKQLFMMMLKRMSIFSTEDYKGVIFNFNDDKMIITSTNPELGESKEEMFIIYPDSPIEVAFNPRYFVEALSVIEEEQVVLSIVDDQTPCLVEGEKDKSYLCVIMPMKI
jgi:DNA polymerase-3 subunit beta